MKLSFIIPFYNGGKYITECIDSLINQNISFSEYEIIIVDDFSNDDLSLDILKTLQASYYNIKIIRNPDNMRAGLSRNVGINNACGDYIWFVDQDDFIETNCVNHLLEICKRDTLDILYFDYCIFDNRASVKKKDLINCDSVITTGLGFIKDYCRNDFWNSEYDTNVWHALYRREWLVSNSIFSPKVSYCEDLIVAMHAIIKAKRIKAITDSFYYYRFNEESVSHTEVHVSGRTLFDGSVAAGHSLIELSSHIPTSHSDLKEIVFSGGVYRLNSFTKPLLKMSSSQRRLFFEMMSKTEKDLCSVYCHFSRMNNWMRNHSKWVVLFPHSCFCIIKVRDFLIR